MSSDQVDQVDPIESYSEVPAARKHIAVDLGLDCDCGVIVSNVFHHSLDDID